MWDVPSYEMTWQWLVHVFVDRNRGEILREKAYSTSLVNAARGAWSGLFNGFESLNMDAFRVPRMVSRLSPVAMAYLFN